MIGNDRYRILAAYGKHYNNMMLTQETCIYKKLSTKKLWANCEKSHLWQVKELYTDHRIENDMKVKDLYDIVDTQEVLFLHEMIIKT